MIFNYNNKKETQTNNSNWNNNFHLICLLSHTSSFFVFG